VRVVFVVSTV